MTDVLDPPSADDLLRVLVDEGPPEVAEPGSERPDVSDLRPYIICRIEAIQVAHDHGIRVQCLEPLETTVLARLEPKERRVQEHQVIRGDRTPTPKRLVGPDPRP